MIHENMFLYDVINITSGNVTLIKISLLERRSSSLFYILKKGENSLV